MVQVISILLFLLKFARDGDALLVDVWNESEFWFRVIFRDITHA